MSVYEWLCVSTPGYECLPFSTKMHVKIKRPVSITYRSYKHICEETYIKDLASLPFHIGDIFDTIDDS